MLACDAIGIRQSNQTKCVLQLLFVNTIEANDMSAALHLGNFHHRGAHRILSPYVFSIYVKVSYEMADFFSGVVVAVADAIYIFCNC